MVVAVLAAPESQPRAARQPLPSARGHKRRNARGVDRINLHPSLPAVVVREDAFSSLFNPT